MKSVLKFSITIVVAIYFTSVNCHSMELCVIDTRSGSSSSSSAPDWRRIGISLAEKLKMRKFITIGSNNTLYHWYCRWTMLQMMMVVVLMEGKKWEEWSRVKYSGEMQKRGSNSNSLNICEEFLLLLEKKHSLAYSLCVNIVEWYKRRRMRWRRKERNRELFLSLSAAHTTWGSNLIGKRLVNQTTTLQDIRLTDSPLIYGYDYDYHLVLELRESSSIG